MFWNKYPYTDFHELNLDMILSMMKELNHDWDEFKAVNEITNAGAWDITKQYQAWTVVSDNNAGYISLKPVPAGVAISNTEYWGLIADYDMLITDLSDRIATLEGKVATLESDNKTNKANITKLRSKLTSKCNRDVIIIGDSYSDGATDAAKIIAASGIFKTCEVVAAGGRGFTGKEGAQGGDTGSALEWYTLFDNWLALKSPDYVADIDDVYIFGGFNDTYGSISIIRNHMRTFFEHFRELLPNVQFHLGVYAWAGKELSISTPNETHEGYTWRKKIRDIVYPAYATCVEYGCEYLGGILMPLHNYTKSFDDTHYHPSDDASAEAANEMLAMMLGTDTIYNGDQADFCTYDFVYSNINWCAVTKFKDHMHIEGNGTAFRAQTNTAVNTLGDTKLTYAQSTGKSDYIAFDGTSNRFSMIPCMYNYNSTGYPGYLLMENNEELWLLAGGSIPANTQILITIGSADLPLLDC